MLLQDKSLWENFLKNSTGEEVKVLSLEPISRDQVYAGGLGSTFFINLEGNKRLVAKISGKGFARELPEDRARDALWTHRTSTLPRQPKAVAVGSLTNEGRIIPLSSDSEYIVVLEEAKGTSYHVYLQDILKRGKLTNDDRRAALNLSDYLVEVHEEKKNSPELYRRHLREVMGHEGILGVVDNLWKELKEDDVKKIGKSKSELRKEILRLETKSIEHVDRISDMTYRCSRMHGDFHPFENIRFENYPTDFSILDRSRAEFGEPADDVTAMWMNYFNHSLLDEGKYSGKFRELGDSFLQNYLKKTGDQEILRTVQPFFVWRGLVISTPIWYPNTPIDVRNKIFNFMKNVSEVEEFNSKAVNSYILD